ncbi:MAG: hypothetical protein D3903_19055 [Candidatus Electrothrix sp. GM3_4]|nr:hypothetical protein [Candidatus Electrothrix sp. GM3_4]
MPKIKPVKIEQLSQNTQAVYDVLNHDSDLACILIGTNFLDQILASLLENTFITSQVVHNLLNPVSGAIGAFSVRSDLSYCLGLIDKPQYQDLIKIATIRNQFAHSYLSLSFGSPEIQNLCNDLTGWELYIMEDQKDNLVPDEDLTEQQTRIAARNKFTLTVTFLGSSLSIKSLSAGVKKKGNR